MRISSEALALIATMHPGHARNNESFLRRDSMKGYKIVAHKAKDTYLSIYAFRYIIGNGAEFEVLN